MRSYIFCLRLLRNMSSWDLNTRNSTVSLLTSSLENQSYLLVASYEILDPDILCSFWKLITSVIDVCSKIRDIYIYWSYRHISVIVASMLLNDKNWLFDDILTNTLPSQNCNPETRIFHQECLKYSAYVLFRAITRLWSESKILLQECLKYSLCHR